MNKLNITVCVKCNSVKKCGQYVRLSLHEMHLLDLHRKEINIVEDICDQCLNGIVLVKKY